MVMTSGLRASVLSIASWPLLAVPTTSIWGLEPRMSVSLRRKNPESSTTRTLIAITTPKRTSPSGAGSASAASRVVFEHAGHIENQRDAAVAGDAGARQSRRALQHLAQGLDDHFFLAHQLVDDEADLLVADGDDHHVTFLL